jgi:putative hydrolase of the HAD superfamily
MITIGNRQIKAIGFDIGETLIFNSGVGLNWKEHYLSAFQKTFNNLEINHSEVQLKKAAEILEEYNTRINSRTVEISCDVIFKRIISETGLPSTIQQYKLEDGFFSYFSQNRQEFYKDTEQTLLKITELGYKIGYLTDVQYGQKRPPDQRSQLILDKLFSFSKIYISSVDVGFRKPESMGFNELANRLKCNCEDVIYVGNEEKDIVGSKSAGMLACLISREQEGHSWGQDMTIQSLTDLIKVLEN